MAKFIIKGPSKLKGSVKVSGSKNAALPILAACLLATKPVTLHNVPDIRDVRVMLEILRAFGLKITGTSGTLTLDPGSIKPVPVPDDLAASLRASILLLGPSVARFGSARTIHPGGDLIGRRPLDTHFEALEALGASVARDDSQYQVVAKGLKGAEIFLPEASVTATENALMAACVADGNTTIRNAASELHVADLALFLNGLGARISGAGTNVITVEGVPQLTGGTHTVRCDELVVGTFMIAAGVTGGAITLTNVDPSNLGLILIKLKEAGLNFQVGPNSIIIKGPHQLKPTNVKTGLWPGFPTDLQPPFTVLMTQAPGVSLIHDWMYEGRFFYTDKLVSMGAHITLADPHRIIVFGPTALHGHELASPDVRAGITMLIAGLIARGETTIDHVEWIERGYEHIHEQLQALGANITRVEQP